MTQANQRHAARGESDDDADLGAGTARDIRWFLSGARKARSIALTREVPSQGGKRFI